MNRAVVEEIRSENAPVADVLAVAKLLLVDQVETVARLDVEREVDVPAENVVGEPQDDLGADACGACGDEQGRIDRALRTAFADVERLWDDLGCERHGPSFVDSRYRQHFRLADAAAQRLNQAFVMHQSDGVARAQAIKLLLHARQLANARQVRQVQFEVPEDAVQRVVAADDEFDGLPERLRYR